MASDEETIENWQETKLTIKAWKIVTKLEPGKIRFINIFQALAKEPR